jgi:hypothetical protein
MTNSPQRPTPSAQPKPHAGGPRPRSGEEPVDLSHPLYDRSKQRLREIVDVCMGSHDGMPLLTVMLSRVPMIGEDVVHEGSVYRVISVEHVTLDLDGRAAFGTHAHLTVVQVPDVGWLNPPEKPVFRRKTRRKSRKKPEPG